MTDDTMERLAESLGDRYAVEGEVDRGGMAVVYLARDLKHGREVAIKVPFDRYPGVPAGTQGGS